MSSIHESCNDCNWCARQDIPWTPIPNLHVTVLEGSKLMRSSGVLKQTPQQYCLTIHCVWRLTHRSEVWTISENVFQNPRKLRRSCSCGHLAMGCLMLSSPLTVVSILGRSAIDFPLMFGTTGHRIRMDIEAYQDNSQYPGQTKVRKWSHF